MQPVDLALVLALDGSASVTYDEFSLMVDGCAAALRDEEVAAGLIGGPHRASLLAVLLWSGRKQQAVLVDWMRVGTAAEVAALADAVGGISRVIRPGTTALGAALDACAALLTRLPAPAQRRVVDVAGDGRNNDGPPATEARDRLIADGVTINGLCVLHEEPDLLASYTAEVIGGPDAFALVCPNYATFAAAMRRKLARETRLVMRAAARPG